MKLAISFDVEATGSSPASGSCIMIGFTLINVEAVPSLNQKWVLDKLQWCISDYNSREDRCMTEFWSRYPKNLEYIENLAQSPLVVAKEISDYLKMLNDQEHNWFFVAAPAAFDWQWLNHFYDKFGPQDKTYLGFKAICMDGMEKSLSYLGYSDAYIKQLITPLPEFGLKMSHLADDDSEYQAYGFLKILELFRRIQAGNP